MIITNVGLDMETLTTKNQIVTGKGVVYSRDLDGMQLEYEDLFSFSYDIDTGSVIINELDKKVFADYMVEIEEKLIDNLETNYL